MEYKLTKPIEMFLEPTRRPTAIGGRGRTARRRGTPPKITEIGCEAPFHFRFQPLMKYPG